MTMQIQVRRDTAANWTGANPTLAAGEFGFETNTGKLKIGDGSTAWNSLSYITVEAPVSGDIIYGDATPKWTKLAKGNNDEVLTLVAGLPAWAVGGGGGGAGFTDNFADASIHWGWKKDNETGSLTITEAAGVLTIGVADNESAKWETVANEAPKLFTGVPGFPCEIITKISSYEVINNTRAGLFVSTNPTGLDENSMISICRLKCAARDGISIVDLTHDEGGIADAAVTTIPIWFKVRIMAHSFLGNRLLFYYSENGSDYTLLYTKEDFYMASGVDYGMVAGIFAGNSTSWTNLSASFEFFTAIPSSGPG